MVKAEVVFICEDIVEEETWTDGQILGLSKILLFLLIIHFSCPAAT